MTRATARGNCVRCPNGRRRSTSGESAATVPARARKLSQRTRIWASNAHASSAARAGAGDDWGGAYARLRWPRVTLYSERVTVLPPRKLYARADTPATRHLWRAWLAWEGRTSSGPSVRARMREAEGRAALV